MQLSTRQAAYVRKKTKHDEPDPSEVAGELNIVPFLDIVTNLILFLLMTSAQVLIVAELDAHLPSLSRGRRASSTPEEGSTLNLSVTITEGGIVVSGSGGKLAPGFNHAMLFGFLVLAVTLRSQYMFNIGVCKGFEDFRATAVVALIATPVNLALVVACWWFDAPVEALLA